MTHTQPHGTMTTAGFIPHLQRRSLFLPVALAIKNTGYKDLKGPHAPQRWPNGALRYVAPGGGVFVA